MDALPDILRAIPDSSAYHKLTPTQRDIARAVAAALSGKEIAHDRRRKLQTVRNHIHSILIALKIPSRTHIAIWWHARGIEALYREDFARKNSHRPETRDASNSPYLTKV